MTTRINVLVIIGLLLALAAGVALAYEYESRHNPDKGNDAVNASASLEYMETDSPALQGPGNCPGQNLRRAQVCPRNHARPAGPQCPGQLKKSEPGTLDAATLRKIA